MAVPHHMQASIEVVIQSIISYGAGGFGPDCCCNAVYLYSDASAQHLFGCLTPDRHYRLGVRAYVERNFVGVWPMGAAARSFVHRLGTSPGDFGAIVVLRLTGLNSNVSPGASVLVMCRVLQLVYIQGCMRATPVAPNTMPPAHPFLGVESKWIG